MVHMKLLLELLAAFTVVTLNAFLNFIRGCFGFVMFLVLSTFLSIAVMMTMILVGVYSWVTRKRKTLHRTVL